MRKRTDLTFRLVALRRGQVSLPLFVWGDPDKIENHRKRENKIQGVALPRRNAVLNVCARRSRVRSCYCLNGGAEPRLTSGGKATGYTRSLVSRPSWAAFSASPR